MLGNYIDNKYIEDTTLLFNIFNSSNKIKQQKIFEEIAHGINKMIKEIKENAKIANTFNGRIIMSNNQDLKSIKEALERHRKYIKSININNKSIQKTIEEIYFRK